LAASAPLTSYALGEDAPQVDEPRPAPDDYPARLEQARRWRADGRGQEAMAEYRTILRNAPDLLAGVMDDLQAILAERPDDGEAHRLMGDALVRQGDYIRALESYNRAVALGDGQH
jgi:tetratricopeptide (TPR) repeat protein